jgi:hypothetical protein
MDAVNDGAGVFSPLSTTGESMTSQCITCTSVVAVIVVSWIAGVGEVGIGAGVPVYEGL